MLAMRGIRLCRPSLWCDVLILGATLAPIRTAEAQAAAERGNHVRTSAFVRSRIEAWDWFDTSTDGQYRFGSGLAKLRFLRDAKRLSWGGELSAAQLFGVPAHSLQPAPLGALGIGGTYTAANQAKGTPSTVFIRQAYLRVTAKQALLTVGRFEFADGRERAGASPTIEVIKQTRLAERLIGPFAFTAVQRSMDGVQAQVPLANNRRWTTVALRPVGGAFSMRAAGQQLAVDMLYSSITGGHRRGRTETDWRVFGMAYRDQRDLEPVDARSSNPQPLPSRRVEVASLGGHWVHIRPLGPAHLDITTWGVGQTGRWRTSRHEAYAGLLEAGMQWPSQRGAPWLRVGTYRSSGDGNPSDAVHRTFFSATPTPRLHARFPAYNGMNLSEWYVDGRLQMHRTLRIDAGIHDVARTSTSDLWYIGGGAFDQTTFGYAGRRVADGRRLGTFADLTVTWQPHASVSVAAYAAVARAGALAKAVYHDSRGAGFAMLETTITR